VTALSGDPWPLRTARLSLRPLNILDAAPVQKLAGNWSVSRTLDVVPYPYPDGLAEVWINETREKIKADGDVALAIDSKAEGLVGVVSVTRRPDGTTGVLGYWLGEPYWGRGYATEAAERMLRFAKDWMKLGVISARVFVENAPSERVLVKTGFHKIGEEERDYPHRGGLRRVSNWCQERRSA
jgi:RimJ/RimL family protein N-acetyltransferase